MVNRAFQYNLSLEKWIECTDENFINADIEKVPSVLVLNYFGLTNYAYCPTHHYIEKINLENPSEIISVEGCKFQDSDRLNDKKLLYCPIHRQLEEIILTDGNEIITDTFCKFNGLIGFGLYAKRKIPFRWRIFQKFDKGSINISADVAEIKRDNSGIRSRWENFFISISITKKICVIKQIKNYRGFFENWTENPEFPIPKNVMDAAVEVLRESTRAIYGFKPTVITKFEGIKKILAYIERPFDVNIILLKNFFADFGDFDKIFPYECTDNYKIICRLLEINPPKSLRKAYAKNPYAIIWYMMFKQFGIQDVNFMQKFFSLDECITVLPLDEFRFIVKTKQVVKMKYSARWSAFQHFFKIMLKNKGEKFFMNWLYKFSAKENLTQNQIDIIEMFYKHEDKISLELKARLWKDGLTNYIHDMISWQVRESLNHLGNVRIIFSPEILKYEAIINGYEFKIVRDTKTLYFVSLELENCVMSYRDKFLKQESIIAVVIRNKKYLACIEIQDKINVIQALGVHNQRLEGELLFVFEIWLAWKNLIDYSDHDSTPIIQCENIETYTDFGNFVGNLILKMRSD